MRSVSPPHHLLGGACGVHIQTVHILDARVANRGSDRCDAGGVRRGWCAEGALVEQDESPDAMASGQEARAMNSPIELETQRLLLRQWKAEDREPFAALNADPIVMEYFPAPL